MIISEVMTREVRVATPDDTLQSVARVMEEEDFGSLPVAENDRLVGMLTDRDITIRAVARGLDGPHNTRQETFMKTRILKLTAILATLAFASACSSTRTQQSAGEVIDDSVLTGKVKVALIDDPITKAGQINVETYRGVVQLGGFVDNARQKDQATTVARSITGVKEVRNDLRISTPQATAGQAIDDGAITASVKAKLIEDSTTKAHQINVETQEGVVQLAGFVDSTAAKARAGELADSVDGVAQVRNDLEIRHR